MLYETLTQGTIVLQLLIVGFVSGIIFDLANFLYYLFFKQQFLKIIFDIFASLTACIVFFILVLNINYGELRFYEMIFFALAIILERVSLGKVLAILFKKWYNFFEQALKVFVQRIKEKRKRIETKKTND